MSYRASHTTRRIARAESTRPIPPIRFPPFRHRNRSLPVTVNSVDPLFLLSSSSSPPSILGALPISNYRSYVRYARTSWIIFRGRAGFSRRCSGRSWNRWIAPTVGQYRGLAGTNVQTEVSLSNSETRWSGCDVERGCCRKAVLAALRECKHRINPACTAASVARCTEVTVNTPARLCRLSRYRRRQGRLFRFESFRPRFRPSDEND